MKLSITIALLCTLPFLGGCGGEEEKTDDGRGKETTITVAAAASLKNAFDEIGRDFEHANPDVTVRFNYAASNILARQIEQGAPFDVVALAAEETMDELDSAGLLEPGSRGVFARNRLGIVVSPAATVPIRSLEDLRHSYYTRIGVGSPGVPVRIYTEEALRKAGLWEKLERHFVYGANVRQVLDYVETGEADCGFVYTSDATASFLEVTLVVDSTLHRPIRYPAAVVRNAVNSPLGRRFVAYLQDSTSRAVLREYGFE